MNSELLFSKTPPLKLFFLAAFPGAISMLAIEKPLPASLISVCTALIFPVVLVGIFWPLGLTGIWLNFAGTALLAGIMSLIILGRLGKELHQEASELLSEQEI